MDDLKTQKCVMLRKEPNINWNKDMGKNVELAPWYHLFQGQRFNDYHLSLAEKKEDRKLAEQKN